MTILRLLVLCVCVSALACGRGGDEPKPAATEPKPAEAHAEADPNTVKIEAGMLRDLRVTTAEVESRPGGEQITLQGELAVDERTYAEVGVPVVARVTRLLVNAGDSVGRGQILAELTSPELGKARADYLSAEARVRLADAALERKRGLAAEKIVPLREVQEAESQAAEARAALRSARAAIGAFGVAPADRGCGRTRLLRVCLAVPGEWSGHRADCCRRADARSRGASVSDRRPLDALVDGACLRARRRPDREGRGRQADVSRSAWTELPRHGGGRRPARGARVSNGARTD